MPVVEITLIEGRSDEAKLRLHEKVAEAIHQAIDAPKDSIRIIIREVPPLHFSAGGVAKGASPKDAS
jgi:4-oxalocrotonate tautomerase